MPRQNKMKVPAFGNESVDFQKGQFLLKALSDVEFGVGNISYIRKTHCDCTN